MKLYALIGLCMILGLACKKEPPVKPDIPERIKLILIDVSVKEVYLHIAVTNPASNETILLHRNGATVMTFAAVADTNIADTALTQTTTYQYTATAQTNTATGTSNTISAQTLAPTSHNFTWQTFLLGDGNNSSLSDVAIINDTLIYAVGELYVRDSTGVIGDTPYNLAKWNGRTWEIKRIPFIGQCSAVDFPPLRGIFAFSATEIYVTNGGSIVRYDGTNSVMDCRMNSLLTGAINKIYGSNTNDVYAVGGGGSIVHFNGTTWRRLESGTTSIINDVWGLRNPVSGQWDVYCVASAFFAPDADKKILRIENATRVDSIRWSLGRNIFGIWSAAGFPLFTAGSGVFENSRGRWREATLPLIYTNAVRGNSVNDVVVVGDFGFAAHYNGNGWFVFPDVYNASYYSVAIKGNVIAMVGEQNARGVIAIGRRN